MSTHQLARRLAKLEAAVLPRDGSCAGCGLRRGAIDCLIVSGPGTTDEDIDRALARAKTAHPHNDPGQVMTRGSGAALVPHNDPGQCFFGPEVFSNLLVPVCRATWRLRYLSRLGPHLERGEDSQGEHDAGVGCDGQHGADSGRRL